MLEMSHKCSSKVSSHQPNKKQAFATNSKKISNCKVSAVSLRKAKELLSCKIVSNDGVPKKRIHSMKTSSRVEVLDSAKVISKQNLPVIEIENETSRVNVLERIKYVAGLPQASCLTDLCSQKVKSVQNLHCLKKLNQPTFQTSVALMEDLDKLKHLEIETRGLLTLKIQKDKHIQNSLNKKVATVLNTSPSDVIFSRLQPISFNVEQMMSHDELRLQHLAEKYAPKKKDKDPEVCLKDFLQCMVMEKTPNLPESSFLEQCYQYHINPFTQHCVPNDNHFVPYSFWIV